jgi:undecaprenyl diphosphate synthase
VAIIMDGNGRWAERRGLPRVAGHRAGLIAARRTVEHADAIGVRCLTLYAFSSDNWRRPAAEVERIFWLLRAFLRLEAERLRQRGARLRVIGRRDRLPQAALRAIERAEDATDSGQGLFLRVAIDYSSREEIARAACDAVNAGREELLEPEPMRAKMTSTLQEESGDVDLLIRTGGEKRLSDFLLWECAYAELSFADRMWPEFGERDLDAAMEEFSRRERRFGGVPLTKRPLTRAAAETRSNLLSTSRIIAS